MGKEKSGVPYIRPPFASERGRIWIPSGRTSVPAPPPDKRTIWVTTGEQIMYETAAHDVRTRIDAGTPGTNTLLTDGWQWTTRLEIYCN